MNLRDMLIREEGWTNKAYPDPISKGPPFTIGVGHAGPEVHEGLYWGDKKVGETLDADISAATVDCLHHFSPWFQHLTEPRQAAIVAMVFQMGIGRFLGFRKAISCMTRADWEGTKRELLDSDWAHQTPARARRTAEQLLTGEWQ